MAFDLGTFLFNALIMAFGVLAILNGHRIYSVFAGIGGVVLGLLLSGWLIPSQPEWVHIVVTLVFGLLGAFLTRLNNMLAIRTAAFVLGGFILQFLLADAGLTTIGTTAALFAVVIGGIIGIILELVYRSSAMIVISSFCGAALVTVPIEASAAFQAALFTGLAAVGMLLQSREWIDTGGDPDELGATEIEKALADL